MPTTAYCYDAHERDHDQPGHPENRRRLESTLRLLKQTGVLDESGKVTAATQNVEG